jgi:AcrR family transcriptional regulator
LVATTGTWSRIERESRTRILAGAGRAFGQRGYGACRVEDIIEEAGVSRVTFYKFFDSKESVFDEIEQAFELSFVHAMQASVVDDAEPWEQGVALIDAYLRWLAGWREVARVLWGDPSRPRVDSVSVSRAHAFEEFASLLAALADGSADHSETPLVFRGLLGAVSEIGLYVIERPRVGDEELRCARAAILQIVVGALQTPAIELG